MVIEGCLKLLMKKDFKSQLFQLYYATICVTVVCKSIQILYTSGANSTNSNNQEGSNVWQSSKVVIFRNKKLQPKSILVL